MTDLYRFDGDTFEFEKDSPRLSPQFVRVRDLMSDGAWRTLAQIARAVGASEASVSARLRDLRKPRFGAYTVDRERVDGGLFRYRLILPTEQALRVEEQRHAVSPDTTPAASWDTGALFDASVGTPDPTPHYKDVA